MRGMILRKMEVARRIAVLPETEQELVRALYARYDRLEFATITPLYVMLMGTIVLPLIYVQKLTEAYGITTLTAGICSGLIWVALCVAVWYGSVQPRRQDHKHAIREIVGNDPCGKRAFDALRRLDPDMARNCGKILT